MKGTSLLFAATLAGLAALPTAAIAQILPDPTNGCGIQGTPLVQVEAPATPAPASLRLGVLEGPGGTLGIAPSVWLADLGLAAYERASWNPEPARRALAPRRHRVLAARH